MTDAATVQAWWDAKVAGVDSFLLAAGVDALWWSYRLAGDGAVQNTAELGQTVGVILRTYRGTDPHRPLFASALLDYIDEPLTHAKPYLVRDAIAALQRWEPRITVDSVEVVPLVDGNASLALRVRWSIASTAVQDQLTEVLL